MFGLYRVNGLTCEITEIITHESANIPAADLLNARPENIIPNRMLAQYCRAAIARVHASARPRSITVPIASPDGQTSRRHIHFEKDSNGTILAIVGSAE